MSQSTSAGAGRRVQRRRDLSAQDLGTRLEYRAQVLFEVASVVALVRKAPMGWTALEQWLRFEIEDIRTEAAVLADEIRRR